ncbi:MAG: HAD family hydrolase [Clostridia bacterium]|nr:HAD family hydrolase [Clostridia bacterium]
MKKYSVVLFDLDGTLTDPGIGITNSVMHALKKYGIEVEDRAELYKFVGPPLIDSFERYYGFSHDEAVKSVAYYREYYRDKGMFENSVYDGIEDLLKRLCEKGKNIILATSKPEPFAKEILRHFDLEKYFFFAAGSTMDETRTNKADVIEYALSECLITDKTSVVMVGDREHDIIGAKKNGIDSIGVLFGYGSREELESAGATYIAETVEDIEKYI